MTIQRYHYPPHLLRMPDQKHLVRSFDGVVVSKPPRAPSELIRVRIDDHVDAEVPVSSLREMTTLIERCCDLVKAARGLVREVRWFFIFAAVAILLAVAK